MEKMLSWTTNEEEEIDDWVMVTNPRIGVSYPYLLRNPSVLRMTHAQIPKLAELDPVVQRSSARYARESLPIMEDPRHMDQGYVSLFQREIRSVASVLNTLTYTANVIAYGQFAHYKSAPVRMENYRQAACMPPRNLVRSHKYFSPSGYRSTVWPDDVTCVGNEGQFRTEDVDDAPGRIFHRIWLCVRCLLTLYHPYMTMLHPRAYLQGEVFVGLFPSGKLDRVAHRVSTNRECLY